MSGELRGGEAKLMIIDDHPWYHTRDDAFVGSTFGVGLKRMQDNIPIYQMSTNDEPCQVGEGGYKPELSGLLKGLMSRIGKE